MSKILIHFEMKFENFLRIYFVLDFDNKNCQKLITVLVKVRHMQSQRNIILKATANIPAAILVAQSHRTSTLPYSPLLIMT